MGLKTSEISTHDQSQATKQRILVQDWAAPITDHKIKKGIWAEDWGRTNQKPRDKRHHDAELGQHQSQVTRPPASQLVHRSVTYEIKA
jgi:hypothetical protein